MPTSPIGQLAVEFGCLTVESLAECIVLQQAEAGGLGRIVLERGRVTAAKLSYCDIVRFPDSQRRSIPLNVRDFIKSFR